MRRQNKTASSLPPSETALTSDLGSDPGCTIDKDECREWTETEDVRVVLAEQCQDVVPPGVVPEPELCPC